MSSIKVTIEKSSLTRYERDVIEDNFPGAVIEEVVPKLPTKPYSVIRAALFKDAPLRVWVLIPGGDGRETAWKSPDGGYATPDNLARFISGDIELIAEVIPK